MGPDAKLRSNWHLFSLLFSVNHGCVTIPLIFATSLLDEGLGYAGSALLYVMTCVCSLFLSAPVVIALGQRAGLLLSMGLYSAFVGSFALAASLQKGSTQQWASFLTGSCLGGVAASVLWTAQGAYLDRSVSASVDLTGEDREVATAQHASVFAVYYLLLEVALKLLCSFALQHVSAGTTFAVYTVFALLSTCGLGALKSFGPAPDATKPSLGDKLFAALQLWCCPELWCLSFTNVTFGFAAAFLNGYVNASYTQRQLGSQWVGYFATITALVAAFCSRAFGVATTWLGSKGPILLIGSVSFGAIPALVLMCNLDTWGKWLVLPYVLQGCGRAVYESTSKSIFADFFPGSRAQGAFANQMMQSTTSFAICFFFSEFLPKSTLAAIVLVLASLTFPFYLLAKRLADEDDSTSSSDGLSSDSDNAG